jgi:SSS family solute:Na+ symporter
MVKRFCTIGWAFTGLIVAALLVHEETHLADKEDAFGWACLHLLSPGLTGLMVACILAANMSTCSNFMVNSGALFTRNIWQAWIRPGASDRELLRVGRMSGLGLTMLGVLFALSVDQVLDAFLFNETLPAFLGIMIFGGILWKRANRQGAIAATVVSLATYYVYNWAATGSVRIVYRWEAEPYGVATLAGFAAFVGVSLLSRPEPRERTERFFDALRRSTDAEGPPTGAEKPLAAERGQDLLLLDVGGWLTRDRWKGFLRRYREDLVGFALAWAAVGLLVLAAWGLLQLGR